MNAMTAWNLLLLSTSLTTSGVVETTFIDGTGVLDNL